RRTSIWVLHRIPRSEKKRAKSRHSAADGGAAVTPHISNTISPSVVLLLTPTLTIWANSFIGCISLPSSTKYLSVSAHRLATLLQGLYRSCSSLHSSPVSCCTGIRSCLTFSHSGHGANGKRFGRICTPRWV